VLAVVLSKILAEIYVRHDMLLFSKGSEYEHLVLLFV